VEDGKIKITEPDILNFGPTHPGSSQPVMQQCQIEIPAAGIIHYYPGS